jgi:hypothetical protein
MALYSSTLLIKIVFSQYVTSQKVADLKPDEVTDFF